MDDVVIPSYLQVIDTSRGRTSSLGVFNNIALRIGEIVGIIYPNDPSSISKKFIEYTIKIQQRDGSDPGTTVVYPNVMVSNLFGGLADTFTYTLRKQATSNQSSGYGNGSKVLVLCINGESNSATIVGGIRDAIAVSTVETQDDGHNLNFTFNGINATIDDSGQLDIIYGGATDAKNHPRSDVDTSATGSHIAMTKDGSITLQNNTESVIIDRPNHKVNISAQSNVTIKSSGVLIGDATDATILGTRYRNAEDSMLNSLASNIGLVGENLAIAAAQLNLASLQVFGPFPTLAVAGTNLLFASQQLLAIQVAIQGFVLSGPYLSTKNKSD
jgi:hypothetical protein